MTGAEPLEPLPAASKRGMLADRIFVTCASHCTWTFCPLAFQRPNKLFAHRAQSLHPLTVIVSFARWSELRTLLACVLSHAMAASNHQAHHQALSDQLPSLIANNHAAMGAFLNTGGQLGVMAALQSVHGVITFVIARFLERQSFFVITMIFLLQQWTKLLPCPLGDWPANTTRWPVLMLMLMVPRFATA